MAIVSGSFYKNNTPSGRIILASANTNLTEQGHPEAHTRVNAVRAIVFDFDGTLVATNINFTQMRQEIIQHIKDWKLDFPELEQQRYVLEMVAYARSALKDSPELARSFEREAMHIIETIEMQTCPSAAPFEKVPETLRKLSARGYRIGIITRNGPTGVKAITSRFPLQYDVLLTRNDVEHVKPHPDHLLKALQALQTPPSHAIMVGDHPTDMACGQAAGVPAVGIADKGARSAELLKAGAAFIVPKVADLLSFLNGSGSALSFVEERQRLK
jgi:phosphoglycolate phosphatase